MCSAWQMWQAVSGPLVCSCRKLPPAAKYKSAAQASSAIPRRMAIRPDMILIKSITLPSTLALCFQQVEAGCFKINTVAPIFLDPATIPSYASSLLTPDTAVVKWKG